MLLPGCLAYLSAEQVGRPTRFTRESKEAEQFARALDLNLQQHERDNDSFMVNSFQDLIEKIPVLLLRNKWMVCHSDSDALHIYKPEFSDQGMKIQACLKAARNLRIFSFRDNLSIPLTLDVLSDIRQIEEIIQETEDFCIHDTNSINPDQLVFHINEAVKHVNLAKKGSDLILQTQMIVQKLLHIFHSFN